MSETSAVTTVNPPAARPKYGTVGKAIPGTDVKLAEDGEILVRGDGVMRGYRNDPDRTAEVLDGAGWIHTGDVGLLDNEGYLTIIDRKKELIINSGGKNMSPSNIEGALKAASPLVGSVAAIGDNRPYVTALITLDPDAAAAFADRHGIADPTPDTLAKHPEVLAALDEAVTTANGRLSRVEGIRRWKVLPTFWLPGGDELTPDHETAPSTHPRQVRRRHRRALRTLNANSASPPHPREEPPVMSLDHLTTELDDLTALARDFFTKEVAPPRREEFAESGQPDRALYRRAGELGLLCMSVPEEYGGGGATFAHEAVLFREQVRGGEMSMQLGVHTGIVPHYILAYANEEQKRRWLPKLASGEWIGAIAMTEPGTGSDLQAITTQAVRDGDDYVISGAKTFISNGAPAT